MNSRKHLILSAVIVAAIAGLLIQRRFAAPARPTIEQLWMQRDPWTGKTVEVVGDLKEFEAGTPGAHLVIENEGYRVGVRGETKPPARSLVGLRVRARGVFVFTEKTGGYLESPELSLSDERR
jgi:hypothetical protein